jgi:hypothetical protein
VLKLCDQITLRTDAILHIYGPIFEKVFEHFNLISFVKINSTVQQTDKISITNWEIHFFSVFMCRIVNWEKNNNENAQGILHSWFKSLRINDVNLKKKKRRLSQMYSSSITWLIHLKLQALHFIFRYAVPISRKLWHQSLAHHRAIGSQRLLPAGHVPHLCRRCYREFVFCRLRNRQCKRYKCWWYHTYDKTNERKVIYCY